MHCHITSLKLRVLFYVWRMCASAMSVNVVTLHYGKINVNDKILIENWGSKKRFNEFPSKDWSRSRLNSLLRQIDASGSLTEKLAVDVPGQEERQSVHITKVEELICSQEDAPGTYKSTREIKQIT